MNRRLSSTNLGRGSTKILLRWEGVQCTWVILIDIYIGNAILQKAARFDRHIQRKQKNTISIDIYLGNWSVKIDMYNGKVIRWDNIHL